MLIVLFCTAKAAAGFWKVNATETRLNGDLDHVGQNMSSSSSGVED